MKLARLSLVERVITPDPNLFSEHTMKKTVLALSLAALSLPALAQQKAPEPSYTVSGNFALVSDYRFRGISQTNKHPAAQGGFDLAFKNGIYLGTWASNVSNWASTDGAGMEIDIYGGYKGSLPLDIGYDIGYIAYYYPGTKPVYDEATKASPKQNTQEVYFGLSKGPVSYKLSYTTSKAWFGIGATVDGGKSAVGSMYHDLSVSFPLTDKLTLSAHVGYQYLKARDGTGTLDPDTIDPSFTDYKVGAAYDLGDGYAVGLAVTQVNFSKEGAKNWFTGIDPSTTKLYGTGTVLSLTKTF